MYQNGKLLNHYAAKAIHRDIIKRKFTPYNYASYEDFLNHSKKIDEQSDFWILSHLSDFGKELFYQREEKDTLSGKKHYYEKWWRAEGCNSFINKKALKKDYHRAARRHNKEIVYQILTIEDFDDLESFSSSKNQYADPWGYD